MAFNGAGLFLIDSSGQPVVSGTLIEAAVFNAFTADVATGLSTCITKDGQTTVTANIPMGGFKITGLAAAATNGDALRYEQRFIGSPYSLCEGRLTVSTGVPIPTSDVLAAETLYFTPYMGSRIALYNGTSWDVIAFTEISIDVPDVTGVHDVFVYNNAGTATLEVLVWSNDTTRATALTTQDGVLVKTGDLTRRYVGTFYSTTAGNGQIEDSIANRFLWNYYHRVPRPMRVTPGGTWNYTTNSFRQANAAAGNQLNFVVGVSEDPVSALVAVQVHNTSSAVNATVSIGADSTSSPSSAAIGGRVYVDGASHALTASCTLCTYSGIGKRFWAWLEYSDAAGTTAWSPGNTTQTGGITGEILG